MKVFDVAIDLPSKNGAETKEGGATQAKSQSGKSQCQHGPFCTATASMDGCMDACRH